MEKTIERMSQDLARARYAKRTCDCYLAEAERLFRRFGRPLAELTRDELRTFVDEMHARGWSASTVVGKQAAIAFLYRKTLGRPDLVSFLCRPRMCQRLPAVLSAQETSALLRAIEKPCYLGICLVMYDAGLRLSEALGLEISDIDAPREVIRVRHGKGDKQRETKLSQTLYRWLRQYWARQRPPAPYLFSTRRTGKPPQPDTVCKAIAQAAEQAGIGKHVTPHVLRHTYATLMLEHGVDVRVLSELLGHKSVQTTARYARVTRKLVRKSPSPLELPPT